MYPKSTPQITKITKTWFQPLESDGTDIQRKLNCILSLMIPISMQGSAESLTSPRACVPRGAVPTSQSSCPGQNAAPNLPRENKELPYVWRQSKLSEMRTQHKSIVLGSWHPLWDSEGIQQHWPHGITQRSCEPKSRAWFHVQPPTPKRVISQNLHIQLIHL